jgi:hypothetical protein
VQISLGSAREVFRNSIEEQWLTDQPPPDREEDKMVTKLRETLKRSLEEVRKNAE